MATGEGRAEIGSGFRPVLGAILFLAGIFYVNFTARVVFAPLLPAMEKDLGFGHSQAGLLFLLLTAGYFVSVLLSGFVSNALKHRGAITASSLSLGVALLIAGFSTGLGGIMVGMLVIGLGAGAYLPSGIATITGIAQQKHWGKALAVHELAPNLAFLSAPLWAELLFPHIGWRGVLLCLSGAAFVIGFAYMAFGKGGHTAGQRPTFGAITALLRNRSYWVMVAFFGVGVAGTMGIYSMLPLYLVTEQGLDRTWANTLVSISRITSVIMAFVGGALSDRIGPKRAISLIFWLGGILVVLMGVLPKAGLVTAVILQPMVAVMFFPAGFSALAMVGPPETRNVVVSITVPPGFLLGAGAIAYLLGLMGEHFSFAAGIMLLGALTFVAGFFTGMLELGGPE